MRVALGERVIALLDLLATARADLVLGARIDRLRCVRPSGSGLRTVVDLDYALLGAGFGLGLHRGALFSVLHEAVRGVRDDVRTMAARQLAMYEELRRDFILVDPTARRASARDNVRPMLETLRWLGAGGAVAMFPAGAISQYSRRARMVIDPPWHPMLGALVRRSGAAVVPVLFHGANSLLFRVIGAINRKLSTALLARELLNMFNTTVRLSIAAPIAAAELLRSGSDEAVTLEIRRRAYALAEAGPG